MIAVDKFRPREYQVEAISNVLEGFNTYDRGKIIMPCGTGKSWTYLWLFESMGVQRTIVFVPSITLIKQIKNDWLEQRSVDFNYLCVCSDNSVDNEDSSVEELGGNVSTNSEDIRTFLIENLKNNIVIFSTYHSADRIIEALQGIKYKFDLIVSDEAHRTAGIDNAFGIVHDNTLLPSRKRLYGTATPRILDNRKKIEGRVYNDMDDEALYGKVLYSMSYKEAIKKGIICDYKIIVVGVDDENIHRMINDEKTNINEAVNVYALQYCLKKYNLQKVISFHSRIRNAEEFSKSLTEIKALHINGRLHPVLKEKILTDFGGGEPCVITNSKCLTEGVNIPTVDGIFYAENKTSIIDIVQSTGRALRKAKGKELGYIIVPVYNVSSDDIDTKDNKFNFLIDIVSSMCLQDNTLQDLINVAVRSKEKKAIDEVKEIIKNNFQFENLDIDISDKLFDYVVNENGYVNKSFEENIEILVKGIDKKRITQFLSLCRKKFNMGILSQDKIETLNSIDKSFLVSKKSFDELYNELIEYINKYDKIPTENVNLYPWFMKKKKLALEGKLSSDHSEKILSIFNRYCYSTNTWEENYNNLLDFIKLNKHLPVDRTSLNAWLKFQCRNIDKISNDKAKLINDILSTTDTVYYYRWKLNLSEIEKCLKETGKLSAKYRNIFSHLKQRQKNKVDKSDRVKQVEELIKKYSSNQQIQIK